MWFHPKYVLCYNFELEDHGITENRINAKIEMKSYFKRLHEYTLEIVLMSKFVGKSSTCLVS